MDAEPLLAEVARQLVALDFEAVLIGNAAAALQGAPVTTIDFDFLFRKTPRNVATMKALARSLDVTILRPYYPASDFYRIVRDSDSLQVDLMVTIHGVRSFAGVRDRAMRLEIGGASLLVASLDDIIKSKRAAKRPRASPYSPVWRSLVPPKKPQRKQKLAGLAREADRADRELIERWQRLPPERRTQFLRKRVGPGRTAL